MNIRILHYNHPVCSDYRISWHDCKAKPHLFFLFCLFSSSSSYFPLKIILKQLFTSSSVNIAEHLPKGAVKYKQEKEKSKYTDENYIEETSTSKANILAETVDFAYEGMSNTRDRWIKVI